MGEAKPLASLSSGLLARKGGARPAMRPQLPMSYEEQRRVMFGAAAEPAFEQTDFAPTGQEDLGWNDMGEDAAPEPVVEAAPAVPDQPEVLRRIETLAEKINAPVASVAAVAAPSRRRGTALKEGRKAAFTLRLDAERHLRLRLASAMDNRSAQALVVEALDKLLDAMPGLDGLVRSARKA
ncbi:hypothetical protein [Novosphingobium cyanobacteriorum]|uniref:Uncharacterized protein n=1 Tax=Novosphingobium cyanobacteriorum TaxID=3024215 RepID=A0ABT6CJZ5_9SPHN|nr:hypothetical protein [Novosphingobium cyanobacteriorum]MDF8334243.1 hypothetical protein [Novosphingobium cyanobacteriorum]